MKDKFELENLHDANLTESIPVQEKIICFAWCAARSSKVTAVLHSVAPRTRRIRIGIIDGVSDTLMQTCSPSVAGFRK